MTSSLEMQILLSSTHSDAHLWRFEDKDILLSGADIFRELTINDASNTLFILYLF
jgi:hypothetical protein